MNRSVFHAVNEAVENGVPTAPRKRNLFSVINMFARAARVTVKRMANVLML